MKRVLIVLLVLLLLPTWAFAQCQCDSKIRKNRLRIVDLEGDVAALQAQMAGIGDVSAFSGDVEFLMERHMQAGVPGVPKNITATLSSGNGIYITFDPVEGVTVDSIPDQIEVHSYRERGVLINSTALPYTQGNTDIEIFFGQDAAAVTHIRMSSMMGEDISASHNHSYVRSSFSELVPVQ